MMPLADDSRVNVLYNAYETTDASRIFHIRLCTSDAYDISDYRANASQLIGATNYRFKRTRFKRVALKLKACIVNKWLRPERNDFFTTATSCPNENFMFP